jgi:sugar/nucleoside kinase (ribokinase family)
MVTPMTSSANADISIVGELNPDLILYGLPRDLPGDREILANGFALTLGSSSAILAHNLSALGSRVSFTSCIGDDLFGEMCSQTLKSAGVEISHLVRAPAGIKTGVTVILPLSSTRRILTYPGAMVELSLHHLDLAFLASARHFHMSSLFLHRKLLPDTPFLFAEMKRRGLTTSLDTNDDPDQEWGCVLRDIFPSLDILFCTERELVQIAGMESMEEAALHLSARIPKLVVKRGPKGASVYNKGQHQDAQTLRVPVIDTVGAGDSFNAGFLHQWLLGAPLRRCLAYGNLAGAFSVTRAGGTEAFQDHPYKAQFFSQHWQQ